MVLYCIVLYVVVMWIFGLWLMVLSKDAKEDQKTDPVPWVEMVVILCSFPIFFPVVVYLTRRKKEQ